MANNIELAQKFLPVLDAIYKKAALTSVLDAATQVNFDGTNTVKVMKVSTTGLGDYYCLYNAQGDVVALARAYNGKIVARHSLGYTFKAVG